MAVTRSQSKRKTGPKSTKRARRTGPKSSKASFDLPSPEFDIGVGPGALAPARRGMSTMSMLLVGLMVIVAIVIIVAIASPATAKSARDLLFPTPTPTPAPTSAPSYVPNPYNPDGSVNAGVVIGYFILAIVIVFAIYFGVRQTGVLKMTPEERRAKFNEFRGLNPDGTRKVAADPPAVDKDGNPVVRRGFFPSFGRGGAKEMK